MGVCIVVCLGVISNMFYYYLHVSYGTTRYGCPYTHIPYGRLDDDAPPVNLSGWNSSPPFDFSLSPGPDCEMLI